MTTLLAQATTVAIPLTGLAIAWAWPRNEDPTEVGDWTPESDLEVMKRHAAPLVGTLVALVLLAAYSALDASVLALLAAAGAAFAARRAPHNRGHGSSVVVAAFGTAVLCLWALSALARLTPMDGVHRSSQVLGVVTLVLFGCIVIRHGWCVVRQVLGLAIVCLGIPLQSHFFVTPAPRITLDDTLGIFEGGSADDGRVLEHLERADVEYDRALVSRQLHAEAVECLTSGDFFHHAEPIARLGWETPEEVALWRELRESRPPGQRITHPTDFLLAARHGLPEMSPEDLAARVLEWRAEVDEDERMGADVTALQVLEILGDDATYETARRDAIERVRTALVELPSFDAQLVVANVEQRVALEWDESAYRLARPVSDAVSLMHHGAVPDELDPAALAQGLRWMRHAGVSRDFWLPPATAAELDAYRAVSPWRQIVRHRAALAALLLALVTLAVGLPAKPSPDDYAKRP